MKKGIIILLASVFSIAANAESAQDMLNNKVSQKPSSISLSNADSYAAEGVNGYEGRNENRAGENLTSQVASGSSVSKTIKLKGSVKDSQLENLESTAGELVQKLEDDRLKKAKRHQASFEKNKSLLQSSYSLLENVNVNQLGSEQDPEVQNAFKCLDIKGCNEDPRKAKNDTDARAIKDVCAKNERLHWNGTRWECVGLFSTLPRVSCASNQYAKAVNGGVACIDYLYRWGENGYTACDSNGKKQTIVKCFQKKKLTDANTTSVADSNCFGSKPSVQTEQCTANWTVGSWGSCSKTCGGGTQTRAVTCPTGYKCNGTKPATSKSCNTQACGCTNPVGFVGEIKEYVKHHRHSGSRNDREWTTVTCNKCTSSLTWQSTTCPTTSGSERKDDTRRNERNGW